MTDELTSNAKMEKARYALAVKQVGVKNARRFLQLQKEDEEAFRVAFRCSWGLEFIKASVYAETEEEARAMLRSSVPEEELQTALDTLAKAWAATRSEEARALRALARAYREDPEEWDRDEARAARMEAKLSGTD